ncbi:hypothetical protein ACNKHN_23020 [Shigella flexneri]
MSVEDCEQSKHLIILFALAMVLLASVLSFFGIADTALAAAIAG